MKILNKIFRFIMLTLIILIVLMLAIVSFSLIVYPTNEYIAVIISAIIALVSSITLYKLYKNIFKIEIKKISLFPYIITFIIGCALAIIFLIPTHTFKSTKTIIEGYGLEPEMIKIHTGEEVAVYVHQPVLDNKENPIIFVNGGPGGSPTHSTKLFLDEYAKLGYTVYTYDPIGCGKSPSPKSNSSYSMYYEVEVIKDIMDFYDIKKANLIASSYGGNVVARYIEKYPELVNSYLSIDTAPIYSMDENYKGQEKDLEFMKNVDDTRSNPSSKPIPPITKYTSIRQLIRIFYGMNLMQILEKDDIPYGNIEEYDYMISIMVGLATNSLTDDGKPTRYMNYLSNILNTASLSKSEDFTKRLKEKKTPPVLVIQPEYGVVPWQIHYQYKEYFSDTHFALAPSSAHAVWVSPSGLDVLIRNGDALFKGESLPDEYNSSKNPFPPIK